MDVTLKSGTTVTLTSVERDDETGVVGITNTGKQFAARRDQIGEAVEVDAGEVKDRHPFRVYLRGTGTAIRVTHPAFEQVRDFYLGVEAGGEVAESLVIVADGKAREIERGEILSVLSQTPADRERHGEAPLAVDGDEQTDDEAIEESASAEAEGDGAVEEPAEA